MSKFDAKKFLNAQDGAYGSYKQALAEIKNGKKVSHWIWYIFPQMEGLGHSSNSQHFAISSLNEARQYLADDVLRKRLIEISEELLKQKGSAEKILGKVDAMKVRSSMTLFREADPGTEIFGKVLDKFYDGKADEKTLKLVRRQQRRDKEGSW